MSTGTHLTESFFSSGRMYSPSNSRVLLSASKSNLSKVIRHAQSAARTALMNKGENIKYEEAVKTLNTLQTNAQTLEKIRSQRDKYAHLNIPNMIKFAQRAGITQADMDRLNVIHVSGTKGKGSTCAFCESILRSQGYKTGFYSSPHLVEVRERFRVNGAPLLRDRFAAYFWDVYNRLEQTKAEHDGAMPNYFGFLTVMALHVFVQEKVNVAIMEVGIGGQYDCTNMLRHPVVCGVSSLGLDHTSILGHTIDKIAWHKAGIFKPSVPAVTAPQPHDAMEVLQDRAAENGAPLSICPDIRDYTTAGHHLVLGIKGSMQAVNASLALQLSQIWIQKYNEKRSTTVYGESDSPAVVNGHTTKTDRVPYAERFPLTPAMIKGLEECQWLGRNQTIAGAGVTFYLDGAHTVESIQQCVDWFCEESRLEQKNLGKDVYRVLIFNTTGDRDTRLLLDPLKGCGFGAALFCPNIAYLAGVSADQTNNTVTKESQLQRSLANKNLWEKLLQPMKPQPVVNGNNSFVASDNRSDYDIGYGVLSDNSQSASKKAKFDTVDDQTVSPDCVRIHNSQAKTHGTSPVQNGANYNIQNIFHKPGAENIASKNCDVESHAFPSISHCITWVIEGRQSCDSEGTELCDTKSAQFEQKDLCDTTGRLANNEIMFTNIKELESSITGDLSIPAHKGEQLFRMEGRHVQVLITGSIHLVGGALRVIQRPDAHS